MTEEQITEKKKHAGNKKPSMKRREDHHDYRERRMYMITMEVEGRQPVFGRLVGNPFAPAGAEDEPRIELSKLGEAVQSQWLGIHGYYPQVEVVAVQMMPDHMHGILFVTAPLPVHLGQVISSFKTGCRKAQRALEQPPGVAAQPQPTENKARSEAGTTAAGTAESTVSTTGSTVGTTVAGTAGSVAAGAATPSSQQATAVPSQSLRPFRPLFARGYNDLILRSYDELPVWQNYLRDNPRRLLMKRARPEWLRPFFDLHLGSHCYSGIGNRDLLSRPRLLTVRVSRRLSDAEIEAEKRRYLEAAQQGAVLVSPAISPGEKRVMRAAFDAGLPTIVIMENGFTPLSKPHGEQFYACAEGRLLMLSPWEHHNDRRKLTAEQCKQMNLMALEICGK